MLSLVAAVCLSVVDGEVVSFGGGREYVVTVCAETEITEWGTAYLAGNGFRKAIAVVTDHDVNWFRRRDGNAVVLLQTIDSLRAFTLTSTGKVYAQESPWLFNGYILYCGGKTAIIRDHKYYMVPQTGGQDPPPEGRLALLTQYSWSVADMRWVSRVIGLR